MLKNLKQKLGTWSGATKFKQCGTYIKEFMVKFPAKNSKGCKHEKWLKQSMLESNKIGTEWYTWILELKSLQKTRHMIS